MATHPLPAPGAAAPGHPCAQPSGMGRRFSAAVQPAS